MKEKIKINFYLGFPSNWCHVTDFLGSQCVYDGTLPDIRVTNDANTSKENNLQT